MRYILERAKERGTWQGLTGVLTLVGIGVSPEQAEAIAVAGTAIASLIAIFTKG